MAALLCFFIIGLLLLNYEASGGAYMSLKET